MENISHYRPAYLEIVEAARARAGLTLLKPQIDDDDIITFAPAKDFALTSEILAGLTDDVSAILCAAWVTDEHRAYVDAITGLSKGSDDWFEADDFEVGKRLGNDKASESSICKRAQRARCAFNAWQKANKISLIEAMPGGKDSAGNLHRTRYRCRIASLAIAARDLAQTRPGYDLNPYQETTEAAAELLKKLEYTEPDKRRFRQPRPDSLSKNVRLLATINNKVAKLAFIEASRKFDAERKELAKRAAAFTDSRKAELDAIVAEYDRIEGRPACVSSPHSYMSYCVLEPAETKKDPSTAASKTERTGDSNPAEIDEQNYLSRYLDSYLDKSVQPLQPKDLQENPFFDDFEPDELSFEASDEANWGDETGADNAIQGGNESYSAASPDEPQGVAVSVVPNETPGSAETEPGPLVEATRALDLFESVGITPTKLILKDDLKDEGGAGVDVTGAGARRRLGADLVRSFDEKKSYILRLTNLPGKGKVAPGFLVDDVNREGAELYRGEAFAILETSPGSFQLWLAVERLAGESDEDLYVRICEFREGVIRALKKHGNEKANPGSGGASRWPGFRNWKPGRLVDGIGPMVRLVVSNFGRRVTKEELRGAGLFLDSPPKPEPRRARSQPARNGWEPSYQFSEAKAHAKGRTDRSTVACVYVGDWAHWRPDADPEEVLDALMRHSSKAQERGERWAWGIVERFFVEGR